MSTRIATRRRTSKTSGYACLLGAAILLIAGGIRFALQIDGASAGAGDSAEQIQRQLLDDGAPADLAAHAAAGFPLDHRDRARLPPQAQLTASVVPRRLRYIAARKNLPLTIVEAVVELGAAAALAVVGTKSLGRATRELQRAAE